MPLNTFKNALYVLRNEKKIALKIMPDGQADGRRKSCSAESKNCLNFDSHPTSRGYHSAPSDSPVASLPARSWFISSLLERRHTFEVA